MKKSARRISNKDAIKKYPGIILSRFRRESNSKYYLRLTSDAVLPLYQELPINYLRDELQWITGNPIRTEFLLMSISSEGSGIRIEEGLVKPIELKLKTKNEIRKAARSVINNLGGNVPFDKLLTLIAKETGCFHTSEELLASLIYNNSKFQISCNGKTTVLCQK